MLDDLLASKQEAILRDWRSRILGAYPEDTGRFLASERDRFANPVGHGLTAGIKDLFSELRAGGLGDRGGQADRGGQIGREVDDRFFSILDGIIRIRSVQDMTPREAVGFVFLLKDVVRETFAREIGEGGLEGELRTFEDRVDRVALMAFETYMRCREDLYNIRIRSIQRGPFPVHARPGRTSAEPEEARGKNDETEE